MTRPSPSSALTLRPPGRRGRHLGLLLVAALAAAFLLVPAAQAAAANSLTITEVGTGTGSTEVECEEGTGFTTCAAPLTELPEGKEVKVTATADPGSEIGTVRGTASAEGCSASPCTFTITEDSEVIVEFKLEGTGGHGDATVEIVGAGEGEVSSAGGFSGSGFYEGNPAIECHGAEPGEGQCGPSEMEEVAAILAGKDGIGLHAAATAGSEFVEWIVEEGVAGIGCGSSASCLADNTTGSNVKVLAVFEPATGPSTQPLTLTTSGSGTGSFECEDVTAAGTKAPCASGVEFPEGDEVKVIPVEGAGSEFVEFNGENAGECSGATCTVTMSGPKSVNAKFDIEPVATQPLAIEVEGEGQVTSSPAGITCTEAATAAECEEDFAESSAVELEADADPGWQFAGWTTVAGTEQGSCENTATPCTTGALSEAVTLKATFTEIVLPEFPVNVTVAGEGEVTGPTIACTESGGTCIEERKETETVTLTAAAQPGSHFVGWTGVACTGGNASATCSFTMPGSAAAVEAEFAVSTTSPLTVFVTGEGTVTSNPAGIDCLPGEEECTGQFEGTVTLTAAPAAGWTFAGWIGCRHASAGTCTVAVDSATEVTAVFLEKGEKGEQGDKGEEGQKGDEGQKGEKGDTGSPGSPGSQGPQGPAGATGPQGPAGAAGATGATGPAGPVGAKGDTGAAGAQGPAGATGPQGPAGKNAKVSCKVTQKKGGKKVKVTCTVKYQGGGAKSSSLHWRLSHGGHTVRRGSAHGAGRLNLGHLRPGRYVLHVQGHREAIVVH